MRVVPRVLVVSPTDLSALLGKTVLWRSDVDRVFASDAADGLDTARRVLPNLIVVDGAGIDGACDLLRDLRDDGATRRVSLAAIASRDGTATEDALRRSGANLVLATPLDSALWNKRLEELLDVPPRREARLPVYFQLWCRSDAQADLHEAVVLNLSVRGMLIDTREPLPVGSTVDLRLALSKDAEPLPVIGLVVRNAAAEDGHVHSGVHFLILRDQVRERLRSFIEAEAKE